MNKNELEYTGELKARKFTVSAWLTFLSPGLGYVYHGELYKGITINFLFLIALEAFVIAASTFKFFPLLPLIVLILGGVLFLIFILGALHHKAKTTTNYILRPYNHFIVYGLIYLFTFAFPLYMTFYFASHYVMRFETVRTQAMLPTVQSGDTLLIDPSAFMSTAPVQGELVFVQLENGERTILRVMATPSDTVSIEGERVYINENALPRKTLKPTIKINDQLLAMVEQNGDSKYLISASPKSINKITVPPTQIKRDFVYVLADNRSLIGKTKIRDSRDFGPISTRQILGKPLYIGWAKNLNRIGFVLR